MNVRKLSAIVACCSIGFLLLAAVVIQFPSTTIVQAQHADDPSQATDTAFDEAITAFLRIRAQGSEAVLAFAETLDADTRALLQPVLAEYLEPAMPVSSDSIEATNWIGINNGGCAYISLQAAVNAAGPGDSLQLQSGTYNDSADFTSDELKIEGGYDAGCLTHSGGATTLNGDGISSVLDVDGSTLLLRDLVISHGGGVGAGIDIVTYTPSHVTLDNTDIALNSGSVGGGAYIELHSYMTATNDSDIYLNNASVSGGGLRVYGTFAGMDNYSYIYQNSAPDGGGIHASKGATVILSGSKVYQNEATGAAGKGGAIYTEQNSTINLNKGTYIYFLNTAYNGGGIYADNSTIIANLNPYFRQNIAANSGGAIYLTNGSILRGSAYIGQAGATLANEAAHLGAGIYAVSSTVDLQGGRIINNHAGYGGAGLYAEGSVIELANLPVGGTELYETNVLTAGAANVIGAGLALLDGTQATLVNTHVVSNSVTGTPNIVNGTGIYVGGGSILTMTNSSIELHEAQGASSGRGAGLYSSQSTVTLDNCDILSNTASSEGGGIRMYGYGSLTIDGDSLIQNNTSQNADGGGIAVIGTVTTTLDIADTAFFDNEAALDGGAIFFNTGALNLSGGWDFYSNLAGNHGGGIAIMDATTVNLDADLSVTAYSNSATNGMGGFLYVHDNIPVNIRANDGTSLYIYSNTAHNTGGGAIAADNDATIKIFGNVRFDSNYSNLGLGGALYLAGGSDAQFQPLDGYAPRLVHNTANNGGAISATDGAVLECQGTVFGQSAYGNYAWLGSGGSIYLENSALDAENCTFIDSDADMHGGAIAAYASTVLIDTDFTVCDPLATSCSVFENNTADIDDTGDGMGGGIYTEDSTVNVDHTIFHGNNAVEGGAFFQTGPSADAQIKNTLIYSNVVTSLHGAGIRSEGGTMLIRNTTLANNEHGEGYSQINTTATVNQSIAWNNQLGGFYPTSGTISGDCNIDQSENVGANDDPMFIDPASGDYHLQSASPAADACTSGLVLDLDGNARPIGFGYDMGAYERTWDYANLLPMVLKE